MKRKIATLVGLQLFAGLIAATFAFGDDGASGAGLSLWNVTYTEAQKKKGKKYMNEGSLLRIGDPVHETLTRQALAKSKLQGADVIQLVRGVLWNDDPCGQLLSGNELGATSGWDWYWAFKKAEKISKDSRPDFEKVTKCPALGRSHFGDLQFLHGMASGKDVTPKITRDLILAWSEMVYGVAQQDDRPLWRMPLAKMQLSRSLPALPGASPAELFHAPNSEACRYRALGSILHVIQDSFANGHVKRDDRGRVVQFHSYVGQDHDKHKTDDAWQGGSTDIEKIRKLKGGQMALDASTRVIELFAANAPWKDLETYLTTGPFAFSDKTENSAP